MIDSDEIYVVPDFISEGYFTQDVIPARTRTHRPDHAWSAEKPSTTACRSASIRS